MLIRNRYLRNNRHAAKLSLSLRKYYYTSCIGLALVAFLGVASLRYFTYDSQASGAMSRRALADVDTNPLPAQRRQLVETSPTDMMEDQCPKLNIDDDKKKCENFRCMLDNFCEFNGPAPTSEYERDFTYVLQGRSRSKSECNAVRATDFTTDSVASDFALHINNTHLKYAEDHLWCSWDEVLGRCVHSGRFCYMLQTEDLCNRYCPAFNWYDIEVVGKDSSKFGHLFSNPDQVSCICTCIYQHVHHYIYNFS